MDEELKEKIRKLARVSSENRVLDFKLSGYIKEGDPKGMNSMWYKDATHSIKPKKKYTYIDYGNPTYQSGKFLIENEGSNKGIVWGIKGYGKKGHYIGDIDNVIAKVEKDNASLVKGIMEKARGNSFVVKTSDKIILHDKGWD